MSENQFNSVFDIIGPVMIGPSSSHTAGAARIGKVVRTIFGELPTEVDIFLYESFAKTYRGHGTDIALVGGLLGMEPDNPDLAKSIELAHQAGMQVAFVPKKEKAAHPNQVTLNVSKGERKLQITGISIGGGNIQISELNGFKINLSMGTPTFIIVHQDVPGMIAQVTNILTEKNINIGTMTVSREAVGDKAIMVIEVDDRSGADCLPDLRSITNLHNASFFK